MGRRGGSPVASSFCSRCSERRWMSSYSTALIRFVFLNPENKNKINPLLLFCLHPVGSDCRENHSSALLVCECKMFQLTFSWLIGTTGSWSASLSKCFLLVNPNIKSLFCVVVVRWFGREAPPTSNCCLIIKFHICIEKPSVWTVCSPGMKWGEKTAGLLRCWSTVSEWKSKRVSSFALTKYIILLYADSIVIYNKTMILN